MKRTEKYLNALKYIKKTVDQNPRISMTKLSRKFKLTPNWYTIPIRWGILEKRGNGSLVKWYWKGDEPNEKMVKHLLKQLNKSRYETMSSESKEYEGVHTDMFIFAKSLGFNNAAEAMGAMGNSKFIAKFRDRKI